ncbi:GNB1L family protein [Megaselia abdita]
MALLPPDPVYVLRSLDSGSYSSIVFHSNDRLLGATLKGHVHLFNLQTNRACISFEAGRNSIIAMHHTNDYLCTQEKGGLVKFWSLTNSGYTEDQQILTNHPAFCRSHFCHEKNLIAIPYEGNSIGLLDTNTFELCQKVTQSPEDQLGMISLLKFITINGNDYLLSGYESGELRIHDLNNLSGVVSSVKLEYMATSLDFDQFTNRGICGGIGNKLNTIYVNKRAELQIDKEILVKNDGIEVVKIRGDRKIFVSGGSDARVRIFSWKSLRPLAVLTEHKTGGISDISFSEGKVSLWNAPIMAVSGLDGSISLWDIYN